MHKADSRNVSLFHFHSSNWIVCLVRQLEVWDQACPCSMNDKVSHFKREAGSIKPTDFRAPLGKSRIHVGAEWFDCMQTASGLLDLVCNVMHGAICQGTPLLLMSIRFSASELLKLLAKGVGKGCYCSVQRFSDLSKSFHA
jgi:hypothetical protein